MNFDAAAAAAHVPEPSLPAEPADATWTERSGLPVVWAEHAGPFVAGLVFRVGRADERATHSGITHLVEHLALPRQAPPGVEFNGFVSGSLTSLWASGDKQQSLTLLRDAAALLSNLPDRVATERRILLTEESGRGHGVIAAAAAARFGPKGEGLIASREFGLRWVELEQASAWAAERFNLSNATLWMTGEPPQDLEILLPAGERYLPACAPAVADVRFPSVYRFGGQGGAGLSLLAPRTTEASVAAAVALERLRDRIRYDEGLSYMVDMVWEPLDAETAHVVFFCDCQNGRERVAARLLRDVVKELVAVGPTEAEIRREVDGRRARLASPGGLTGILFSMARDELFGMPRERPASFIAEAEAVTPAVARAAIAGMFGSALLITQAENWQPEEGWSVYPEFSATELPGRSFRPAVPFHRRLKDRKSRLRLSPEGVTIVTDKGSFITVPFEDCVAAERWPDGTRVLTAADCSRLVLDPNYWRHGKELIALVDEHVPADRIVPMNPAVEEATVELARRLEHLRRDIEATAGHLEFGELPLDAIRLKDALGDGTLIVTEERLIFTRDGTPTFGVQLSDITGLWPRSHAWPGTHELAVEVGEETHTFGSLARRTSASFVQALSRRIRNVNPDFVLHEQPRWLSHLPSYASMAALPISLIAVAPLAALEDVDSHSRIILLSLAALVGNGGICGVGIWLGLIGKRHAARHKHSERGARTGIILSTVGVFLWVAFAIAAILTEW